MGQFIRCPVCDGACSLLDVVDFNKSCEELRGSYLELAGTPVYYTSCKICGFCFAPEFRTWTLDKFEKKIYNSDYIFVDPDYVDIRPRTNAAYLISMFGGQTNSIRHLDYGGGCGVLVKLLRESNWNSFSYDPFVDKKNCIESFGKFDLITAFEVFEHVPDVQELMLNLSSLLTPDGLILFSTLLSDGNIHPNQRLNWWYAAPRNGHISLFSSKSLAIIAQKYGFNFRSLSSGIHVLFTKIPTWADFLIMPCVNMITLKSQNTFSTEISIVSQATEDQIFSENRTTNNVSATLLSCSAESLKIHGNSLLKLGHLEAAEKAYRQALEIKPDFGEAYNNLGNVLRLTGRFIDSEQAFLQALTFMPDSAEVHNNFGNVLLDLGRYEEAEQVFRKAVILKPDFSQAYNNRGNALMSLERWQVAEKSYRQAISFQPDYSEAYNNLGLVLVQSGDLEEAQRSYRTAIALNPMFHEAYNNLGLVLTQMGQFDEAERIFLQVISLMPGNATKEFNLSLLYLLQGRFEEGFKLYEQRFDGGCNKSLNKTKDQLKDLQNSKQWKGESLNNKSLIIIAEQGAGDNLMMMRYIPLLRHHSPMRLFVYCEPHLKRLFQSISNVDETFSINEPLPIDQIDLFCTIMSFPNLFQTRFETIPDKVPYLFVPDSMRNRWRDHFNINLGLKVGIAWAGNKLHLQNNTRSIPLHKLSPLVDVEGIQLVSLQKGDDSRELLVIGWDVLDMMDMCEDFLDTASLVSELDLVISVDTSIAHLAGALGKPVWLLNRFESEWRWMLERTDSPWYPSMKIFRQRKRGDWDDVILRVTEELVSILHSPCR